MSSLLTDAAAVQVMSSTPWPDDAKLYQPYEVEQILLNDFATCLAVKAYLKMCKLPFTVEFKKNAEFMSPSGEVPFIRAGNFIVSEFQPIISFAANKGHDLNEHLSEEQKADMKAYVALVNNCLHCAELWISWCDKKVASQITRPRYSFPFTWPLSCILPRLKQRHFVLLMKYKGWTKKSFNDVCEEVRICCQALSEKLAEQDFFFGSKPTELDALVFGHLYTLLSTQLPRTELAKIVYSFPNLSHFCTRIDNLYLKEKDEAASQ